ncbi:PREDICTED: nuclear pore complex protein DDB_G0274915-like [Priapulus caudatus]|uniref:Nuclear pore complex protein DDB_G0274915-like n=1 Tax=Priapulus caudatus TaxID=37621 RepID=A0ABM1EKQ2_PRICU|nr:PREDICTED: nuclear pore complex protein DDB_G0274915-like [Priapulus caudatus]
MFGQQQQQQQGAVSGSFGSAAPSTSTFSVTAAAPNVSPFASGFGQQPVASGNAFQQTASFGAQPSTSGFGQISTQPPAFGAQSSAATYGQFNAPPPAFGAQTAGTTFGQSAFGQQSAAGFSSSGGQPPPYTSLFGTAATSGGTTTAASMFASPVTTNSVFGTPSGGQAMTVSSPPSAFGQTTLGASPLATSGATVPTFGQQTTSGFPGAQTSARNFGGFPTGGATFGQPMASGVPAGGAAVQPERSGGPFSQNASGLALGFGGGGQVGNAASMFAVRMTSDLPVTRQATLTFGQAGMAASSFGQPGHQSAAFTNQQQSVAGESMFASNAPGGFSQSQMAAGFSQSSSVPTFGQPSSGASLAFGQPSASTGFSFGQPSINAAPTLGQPSSGKNPTFGESRTPKSLAFGQPSTSSSLVFGQPSTSSSLSFGQPSASKSITFGQPSSSTISTFGQQKTGTAFGHPVPGTSKALGQSGTSTSLTFGRHSTSTSRAYPQKVTSSHTYGGITSGRPMFGSTTHDSVSVLGGAAKNPQRTEIPSSSGALPTTRMLTVSTAPSGGKTGATAERVFGSKSGQASDPKSLFALPLGGAAQPGVAKPSIFGGRAALQTTGPSLGVFGGATSQQSNLPGSVFGGAAKHKSSAPPTTVSGAITQQTDPTATPFGQLAKAPSQSGSVFGPTGGTTSVRSLFGAETAGTSSSRESARTFLGKFPESGNPSDAAPRASSGAEAKKAVFAQKKASGSMFGQKPEKVKSSASLFGDATEKEAGYGETAATEEEGVAQDEDASTSDAAEVATVTPGVGASRISRSGLQAVAGRALAGAIRRQSGSDRGSLRQSRFASQEQIGHLTAVICKGVPATYNNRSFLTQHFSNYGRVQRVTAQPRAGQATIFFADHESAERAKRKGRVFKKGLAPIDIFWRASTTGGAADRSADKTERKGSQRPLVDDEVQAELRAMSGYSDLASDSVHLLDRPKDPPARSRRARDLPIKAGWRSALPEGAVAPPRRRAPPSQTRGGAAVEKPTVKAVSLESLGRVVARTAKERYDVLEERDKLLRQGEHDTPRRA